jgi:hypothetical protein
MAEDSGAFKTNPANSGQIPAFRNDPGCRGNDASPAEKTFRAMRPGVRPADF